jgi:chemotaxis protein MotB
MNIRLIACLLGGLVACAPSSKRLSYSNRCPPPLTEHSRECVTRTEVINVVSDLAHENDAQDERLSELERALRTMRKGLADALVQSLKDAPKGMTQVTIIGGRVRVRLSNELLFPSGSAKLGPEGVRTLNQVAAVLRDVHSRRIEVAGHTDDAPIIKGEPGREDNWQLSAERARAVTLHLISAGLPGERLYVSGYADTDPVEPNTTAESRARNRRVELFIEPQGKTVQATR